MARLSVPNRRNVKRALFGALTAEDKIKVDKWLHDRKNEVNRENVEKSKFWGFDFTNGVPYSGEGVNCDFRWFQCSYCEVPTFYRSKDDEDTGSIPSRPVDVGISEKNVNDPKAVSIAVVASTSSLTVQQQTDLSKKSNDFTSDVDMTTPLKPSTETSSQTVTTATVAPPPVNPKPKKQHQTQLSDFYRTKRGKRSARTSLSNKFGNEDPHSSSSSTDSNSPLSSFNDTDDDGMDEGCRKMFRFDNQSAPSFATTDNSQA